ncbi:MAG: hypothetical protein ACPHET_09070 [Miltoncostaeaceae bacterium]
MNRSPSRTLTLCVAWNPCRHSIWVGSIDDPDDCLAALRGDGFTAVGWMSDEAHEERITRAERRARAVIAGRGARRVGAPGCFAIGPALLVGEACAVAREAYLAMGEADGAATDAVGAAAADPRLWRSPGRGLGSS